MGNIPWRNQNLSASKLPSPGPYLTKFALQSVIRTLNEAIEVVEMAEAQERMEEVKAALATTTVDTRRWENPFAP